MKLYSLSLIVLLGLTGPILASNMAWAQEDYNQGLKAELNQEINQLYPKKGKEIRTAQRGIVVQEIGSDDVQAAPSHPTTINVTTQAAPTATAQQVVQQAPPQQQQQAPIYIMQAPVQQQPTQNVEASARENRVDQLRKQREEIERQTEDKLIQKLEDDRLLSEKDRADRLFNPSAAAGATVAPTGPAVIGTSTQASAFTPVQVVSSPSAVAGSNVMPAEEIATPNPEEQTMLQIGGIVGIGDYPAVQNVKGVYATGLNVGLVMPGGLGVDASLLFSSYDVTNAQAVYPYAQLTRMDQINVTGGMTYQILSGRVRPVIGVLAGYTRRSFDNSIYYSATNNESTVSHAIDGGLLIGLDVQVAKRLSVGADLKYMMNLSSRTDNPYAYEGTVGRPIEGISYYFATLNLKFQL